MKVLCTRIVRNMLLVMFLGAVQVFGADTDAANTNLRMNQPEATLQGSPDVTGTESGSILQPRRITGKVTDEDGEPIPGVNVIIKGTTKGGITDQDGNYSIEVEDPSAVLVFSFIGYANMEVPLENRQVIDVTMQEDFMRLDEVVVTGYGSTKVSDLTGSVVSVDQEDLADLPTQRVDQSLQGKAAGVFVLNTDGAPGGNTRIRIRGFNSIYGGNQALVVIDGLLDGNIDLLDPNEIESVEVLKDASATAIYGSKGANGVILITTKSGTVGKPTVNYKYSFGSQEIIRTIPTLTASQYVRLVNEENALNNLDGVPDPIFTEEEIAAVDAGPSIPWQDRIYQRAPMHTHQISVTGGNQVATYFFSGGYLDQEGILLNSGYERLNLRGNIRASLSDWAEAGLNVSLVNSVGNVNPFGGQGWFITNPVLVAPLWGNHLPTYDEDGNYTKAPVKYGQGNFGNPVAESQEQITDNRLTQNNLLGFLKFEFIDGLTLNVSAGGKISANRPRYYQNSKTRQGTPVGGLVGTGNVSNNYTYQFQNTNILSYDRIFGSHNISVTAVAEQQITNFNGNYISASQFPSDITMLDDLGSANIINVSSNAHKRVLNSFLGRINYILADRYMVTASYRADGSSVFGANTKWGYFPSAALAWRVSDEPFMQNMVWLNNLKFRGSWGITGNQAISPYNTLDKVQSGGRSYGYPYNGSSGYDLGMVTLSPPNPDLQWETTTQTNLGIDLGILRGRLRAQVDIFQKQTDNLLLARYLPYETGYLTVTDNLGSTENKGVEVALSADPFVREFRWTTGITVTSFETTVTDLGDNEVLHFSSSDGGYGVYRLADIYQGESFGNFYGFRLLGLWGSDEAEEARAFGQLPGMEKYYDKNQDGFIDSEDKVVIGNYIPDFFFGWHNRMFYKDFDLVFLLQGSYGNDIFNQAQIRRMKSGTPNHPDILDRWTPQNQDTNVPAWYDYQTVVDAELPPSTIDKGQDSNATSRWVEDGSYVRLKYLTLGYTLPSRISSRLRISKLRAFVNGSNLITLTNYTGYDPEVSSFNNNDASGGIDLGNYPAARIYSVGLELSF